MRAYLARNVLGVIALGEDGRIIDREPYPREPGAVAERLGQGAGLERLEDYEVVTEEEGPNPAGEMLRRDPWGAWGVEAAEYYRLVRGVAVLTANAKLGEVSQERDRELIQALQALQDLEESLNLLTERASEWQALHRPGGADEGLPGFVRGVEGLSSLRERLEGYVTGTMEEVAPNLAGLLGPLLGARLIAEAKGLESLARMPGSRIQVLGARRAIFQHMRGRQPPPKYGIIFQHPLIKGAPWWQRGKIARSLGAKAAIAARLDAFSGEYLAEGLKERLERRVEEVRRKYPSEPKRLRIIKRPKVEKKRWKRKRR
ncbi:MAG: hypothetical protein HY555_04085 [Euryarchaeota archaeon]|nr:hypothetical protein [Euryarchaeota archaeon]